VNLNRLLAVYDLLDRPDLRDPPFTPRIPPPLGRRGIFDAIKKRDILLHHPFDSFAPVMDFVQQAADDPTVLAIKHTLYRTTPDSPIVDSLVRAARAGKEVTVIVELRARFDEAANIELATKLQEAGVHVVYGVVGYKTHCKMILIVRREGRDLERYVHLGTGNYHPRTTRLYTDYGLLTVNEVLAEDVHQIFMQLTSLMRTQELSEIYQSPFTLHGRLLALIEREQRHVEAGGTGHIVAKVNALVEPEVIRALYRASLAGVHIDLVVRGICCLRPEIPGISENIRVRSIVSRFLEHTRCYYFYNDGTEEVYCSSADWMDRNFYRRVELMFPILDRRHRERVIADLDLYLADNTQAWALRPSGRYEPLSPERQDRPISAQRELLRRAAADNV
jgi:polyphosphate kinase